MHQLLHDTYISPSQLNNLLHTKLMAYVGVSHPSLTLIYTHIIHTHNTYIQMHRQTDIHVQTLKDTPKFNVFHKLVSVV